MNFFGCWSFVSRAPEVCLFAQILARLPQDHFCFYHILSEAQSKIVIVCDVYLQVKIVAVRRYEQLGIKYVGKVDVLGRVQTL